MSEKKAGVMIRKATFSPCRKYRYVLYREWDIRKPCVVFIGLNPSKADENRDDNTITRCIAYALNWGYGSLFMLNIFAYRATDPKEMKAQADPIGIENDEWLRRVTEGATMVVAMWGNHGAHRKRSEQVLELLRPITWLHCFGLTGTGQPKHPLFLRGDLKPEPWGFQVVK